MKEVKTEIVHYYPDDKDNKVFAVDVYITVCKTIHVEAKDRDAAQEEAWRVMRMNATHLLEHAGGDREFVHTLAELGFHDAEETEYRVSGEANELGEIEYY